MSRDAVYFSLGLLGYPLVGSHSPRLHTAALQAMGLPGEYRLYPIAPGGDRDLELARIFESMRSGAIHGLNVTIPHKQAVLPFMDALTSAARSIGAVNTILCHDRLLTGDNTDAPGFLSDLQRVFPETMPSMAAGESAGPQALVLGAGGAARAVVFALSRAGWSVAVAARRLDQAQALAAELKVYPGNLSIEPLLLSAAELNHRLPVVRLLVNATPAGMLPEVDANPWLSGLPLPVNAAVYDLVYKPPETAFLRQARLQGLAASNGLGMLVEQAALALERWTGLPVPRQTMWQAL